MNNRCSGTKLLAEVLIHLNLISHKLPTEDGELRLPTITPNNHIVQPVLKVLMHTFFAVEYLVMFYCDRLKDRAILLPHVLAGIHAMVGKHSVLLHFHLQSNTALLNI